MDRWREMMAASSSMVTATATATMLALAAAVRLRATTTATVRGVATAASGHHHHHHKTKAAFSHAPRVMHARASVASCRRLVVVGDVHGCATELEHLLKEVAFDADAGDELALVGDLVRKGPDSKRVVQIAMRHRARCVRGNHDHYVIVDPEHNHLGLSPAELEFLAEMPLSWMFDFGPDRGGEVLMVHAGVVPGVALDKHDPMDLMTMRNVVVEVVGEGSGGGEGEREADRERRRRGTPRNDEGVPWAPAYGGPTHVVFGHDAVRKLQLCAHATGLDTGCVYGGALTALELPSRRLVSVPSLQPRKHAAD